MFISLPPTGPNLELRRKVIINEGFSSFILFENSLGFSVINPAFKNCKIHKFGDWTYLWYSPNTFRSKFRTEIYFKSELDAIMAKLIL